jgi:AraC-like DNA-binding protein
VEHYAFPMLTNLAPGESALLKQAWRGAVAGSEMYANMQDNKKSTFESAPEYMSMQSRQWEWLAELCRVVRSKIVLKSVSLDIRIEDACQFIQRNLVEKLTVEALATRLYMSESHFRSLFKANTGLAPAEYIRKSRIGLARNMILAGDGSLTDISALAGFASQSEFCRVFRQEEGMSPLQYKKKFVHV